MALRIALYKDTIRKTGALVPRVVHQNYMDFEEFLIYMSKVSGAQVPNLRSVLQHFGEALADQLANGYQVRTPVGTFVTGIHVNDGSTVDPEPGVAPRIDPANLSITLRPDRMLLQTVRQTVNVQVVDRPSRQNADIQIIQNVEVSDSAWTAQVGQIIHIGGNRLSFDKANLDTGVFFVRQDDDQETRASVYSRIGSNNVDCKVPELVPGKYYVEIRTNPNGSTDIRTGTADETFTVL
jgi:hypothetical protein